MPSTRRAHRTERTTPLPTSFEVRAAVVSNSHPARRRASGSTDDAGTGRRSSSQSVSRAPNPHPTNAGVMIHPHSPKRRRRSTARSPLRSTHRPVDRMSTPRPQRAGAPKARDRLPPRSEPFGAAVHAEAANWRQTTLTIDNSEVRLASIQDRGSAARSPRLGLRRLRRAHHTRVAGGQMPWG